MTFYPKEIVKRANIKLGFSVFSFFLFRLKKYSAILPKLSHFYVLLLLNNNCIEIE